MARLSLNAIEERVASLANREAYDREFIFDMLLAYGKPQGNVTRLRNGSLNVAIDPSAEAVRALDQQIAPTEDHTCALGKPVDKRWLKHDLQHKAGISTGSVTTAALDKISEALDCELYDIAAIVQLVERAKDTKPTAPRLRATALI